MKEIGELQFARVGNRLLIRESAGDKSFDMGLAFRHSKYNNTLLYGGEFGALHTSAMLRQIADEMDDFERTANPSSLSDIQNALGDN
jgi:hypothetical protein